jgi:CheY-like chemotaxis protein
VLDLNEVVGGIAPMLRSLIRENLELAVSTAERPCLVRADGAQLERIILNLVVNARDAIPDTGRIEIATRQVDRGGPEPPAGEAPGTDAVALAVSDTGSGIADETRRRLFDPFFTTKEPGAGTGLGLSIVYGLVDQLDGTVTVDSEPGHGATFTVFIPAVSESGGADVGRSSESEPVPVQGGEETVLVVEDDAALRSLVELILAEAGYSVLTAGDGAEALEVVDGGGAIDLVLTDSIMPRVSGSELIRRLAAVRPATRVLQMTGYSDLSTAGGDVIAKPFEPETLLRRVRQVLDGA